MAIVDVKVPQLSESVAEATMLTWKKKAGEAVAQDEILIEIETDKVVLEVPAPSAGVLAEIVVGDGGTVVSDQVIAKIDSAAKAAAAPAPAPVAAPAAAAPDALPAALSALRRAPRNEQNHPAESENRSKPGLPAMPRNPQWRCRHTGGAYAAQLRRQTSSRIPAPRA